MQNRWKGKIVYAESPPPHPPSLFCWSVPFCTLPCFQFLVIRFHLIVQIGKTKSFTHRKEILLFYRCCKETVNISKGQTIRKAIVHEAGVRKVFRRSISPADQSAGGNSAISCEKEAWRDSLDTGAMGDSQFAWIFFHSMLIFFLVTWNCMNFFLYSSPAHLLLF